MRPRETPSHVWYLWQNWNRQVPIEASSTSLRFAVIGAGRLGASLALALRRSGLALTGFVAASAAGRVRAEEYLAMPAALGIDDLVAVQPDLYFICVPDAAVAPVAAELGACLQAAASAAGVADPGDASPTPPPSAPYRPVVAHTSGATSVSVLRSCERAGAAALVFHPLQTFPEPLTGASRFSGAGVALTPGAADPDAATAIGMQFAASLGMRPFSLADEKRTLYHAAASVACNYLVTLEHVAGDLFVKAGLPEREALSLFLPLVTATLDGLAAGGPVEALTGPLSRGDLATIEAHLEALASDAPTALPLYRTLGLATLDLVTARGELTADAIARMKQLLANGGDGPRETTIIPVRLERRRTGRKSDASSA